MLTLETERLILRDFQEGDYEDFVIAPQDPEYNRYYSPEDMKRENLERIFHRIIEAKALPDRKVYQMAVCLKSSGEYMGTCGVRMESVEHKQASFGCAFLPPYWKKGYAFEASQFLVNYGFSTLPIHRLYAETIGENWRARKLAERLGMHLEGELVESKYFHGKWWNQVIYALRREEWAAKLIK